MGFFAMKRFAGAAGCDPRHYVSLVCEGGDWSEVANFDLPFRIDDGVSGSRCGELIYFMGEYGQIVVCNIMTRMWKLFPLPSHLSDLSDKYLVSLEACGLGCDPKLGEYKLFRSISKSVCKEEREGGDVVSYRYRYTKVYNDMYSFSTRSWRKIEMPSAAMMYSCAVYAGGSCYWTAVIDPDRGSDSDSDDDHAFRDQILAFDIVTEEFSRLSFPKTSISGGEFAQSQVVEFQGSLAALIYDGPDEDDWDSSIPLHIILFVRQENTWEKKLNIKFDNVERPLGFGQLSDGCCVLYLEGKHTLETSELMVYDLNNSKELKRLGIYEDRSHMIVIPFDWMPYQIPDSTPMTIVDDIVQSGEDVEEMKTEIDPISKSRAKKKMRSWRRRSRPIAKASWILLSQRKNKMLPKHPAEH